MEIIGRSEARKRGLTRYFTGKSCKRGHVAERMCSTLTCLDCKRERDVEIYKSDPAAARSRARSWQDQNRARHNARAVAYQTQRKASDPAYAFLAGVKIMVVTALSRRGYTKKSRTFQILGCTGDEFAAHIERQFLPGMGWHNRSAWHLDHIVALATATTEADVLALNHFTNLRPLWKPDNLAKGAKQTHLI